MATNRDRNAIKIIKLEKKKAKEKGEDVAESLSGEDHSYLKALKAMQSSAEWGVASKLGYWVVLLIGLTMLAADKTGTYNIQSSALVAIIITAFILTAPSLVLSIIVISLKWENTPSICLASAITNLIFDVILFSKLSDGALNAAEAIIIIVSFIFQIIAICKWASYRRWFYDIDVDAYIKKAKRVRNGTKK